MPEKTTVRQNMMKDKNYRPYCGQMSEFNNCSLPRVGKNFKCPECGFELVFEKEFFERYRAKWGK